MADITLQLAAEELENSQANIELMRGVVSRTGKASSLFGIISTSDKQLQAFIAPSPEIALQWICQRVQKRKLLHVVGKVYDNESLPEEEGEEGNTEEVESADESPRKSKRQKVAAKAGTSKRTKGTNAQRRQPAKPGHDKLNEEQQRYKSFMDKLPSVNVDVAVGMIAKAASVATNDCLKDWRAVLKVWRAQQREGKSLFSRSMPRLGVSRDGHGSLAVAHEDSPSQSQLVLSQSQHTGRGGLSRSEAKDFKNLFFAAQKSHATGIVGDMRHRWIMAAMYTEYEDLERRLRDRAAPSGGRGRGFATVAREQLFASVYTKLDGSPASREDSLSEWKEFGHWLDYGKRWSMLYQKFGIGIFALLPRGSVTNTYVERTLPITRFTDWIEMIANCNEGVYNMVAAIKQLYIACMTDDVPPATLGLECLDEAELQGCDPVEALGPWNDPGRDVHEVWDEQDVELDEIFVASTCLSEEGSGG